MKFSPAIGFFTTLHRDVVGALRAAPFLSPAERVSVAGDLLGRAETLPSLKLWGDSWTYSMDASVRAAYCVARGENNPLLVREFEHYACFGQHQTMP